MRKSVLLIGLGRYGRHVAQKLHDAFAQMDTSNLLDLSSIFGVVEDTGEEGCAAGLSGASREQQDRSGS